MASDEADGRDTVKGNVKYSRRKRLLRMKCSIEISSDAALPVVLCLPFGGADARNQFASHEPIHGCLCGTFGDANGFRHLSITHLNGSRATLLFPRKPQVHQETDGPAIMSDQIAHQDVDDVVIHRDHSYTNYYYSSPWLIATAGPCKLGCVSRGGTT